MITEDLQRPTRPSPCSVRQLLADGQLHTVFQPIVKLDCGLIYGQDRKSTRLNSSH